MKTLWSGRRRFLRCAIVLLCAFVAMTTGAVRGQDERISGKQVWLAYEPTWKFNDRWSIDLKVEARINNPDSSSWQMRFNPTLAFTLRRWIDLTGGIWLIHTHMEDAPNQFETRPQAGVRLKHELWRGVALSNHTRAEARIQHGLGATGATTAFRLRERVQAMIPINRKSISEDGAWRAFVDAEGFWQRNPNDFFSRQRYRAGLSWRKNATWTYEFFYGLQRSRNAPGRPLSVEHIFSFDLIHNIVK